MAKEGAAFCFFSTSWLPVENVDVGHSLDKTNQQEITNLAKNTNMSIEKPTINIVVIGNASVGKSTIVRHFEGLSKHDGVLGSTDEISIRSIDSSKFKFNIIDTPGRPNLMEDTIVGMSMADIGLLVVDSTVGSNESDVDIYGVTKEHCLLLYTLGVKQIVVAITKMDDENVNFEEDQWKRIRFDIASHLKRVQYKPMAIPFVPVSGLQGENLDSNSIYMPWYAGPSLREALFDNVRCPKRPTKKPLRAPIQGVLDREGIGRVIVGRVESGVLQTGMNIHIAPSGIVGVVESLYSNLKAIEEALPGDLVDIRIKEEHGLMKIQPGHVVSNCDDRPAREVTSFEAQLIVYHPGTISSGYNATIHCHTSQLACTIIKIKEKLDPRSGKLLEEHPESVKAGDVCLVEVKPTSPLCIEQFKDFPALGRFAVRDLDQTVGVGVVKTTFFADENGE